MTEVLKAVIALLADHSKWTSSNKVFKEIHHYSHALEWNYYGASFVWSHQNGTSIVDINGTLWITGLVNMKVCGWRDRRKLRSAIDAMQAEKVLNTQAKEFEGLFMSPSENISTFIDAKAAEGTSSALDKPIDKKQPINPPRTPART